MQSLHLEKRQTYLQIQLNTKLEKKHGNQSLKDILLHQIHFGGINLSGCHGQIRLHYFWSHLKRKSRVGQNAEIEKRRMSWNTAKMRALLY